MTKQKLHRAPNALRKPGREFWRKVHGDYVLEEAHDLERLFMACRCLDTIEEAEKAITADGHFVKDRFNQTREHPGLKTVRDNKIVFCRIIRELGLDLENAAESRPPRQY